MNYDTEPRPHFEIENEREEKWDADTAKGEAKKEDSNNVVCIHPTCCHYPNCFCW